MGNNNLDNAFPNLNNYVAKLERKMKPRSFTNSGKISLNEMMAANRKVGGKTRRHRKSKTRRHSRKH